MMAGGNKMNIMMMAGVAVGLFVGLILVVILFKFANTNHRMKTEYDERQKEVRGRAYMAAFYTMMVFEVIFMLLSIGDITLPIADYSLHFIGIAAACTVLGGYCIWHDVYWGLNNDHKRYYIVFAVCIVLNIIPIVGASKSNTWKNADGRIGIPALNVMVITMMAILGIELIVKGLIDRNRNDEED